MAIKRIFWISLSNFTTSSQSAEDPILCRSDMLTQCQQQFETGYLQAVTFPRDRTIRDTQPLPMTAMTPLCHWPRYLGLYELWREPDSTRPGRVLLSTYIISVNHDLIMDYGYNILLELSSQPVFPFRPGPNCARRPSGMISAQNPVMGNRHQHTSPAIPRSVD
jgi:hypothetical protein